MRAAVPLALALLAVLVATPAFSLTPREQQCEGYTQTALADVRAAQALGCFGPGGYDPNDPEWSTRPSTHTNWCLGLEDFYNATGAEEKRRYDLAKCSACRRYADDAAAMADKNVALKCNLDPRHNDPSWQTGSVGHFGWCMGLTGGPYGDDSDNFNNATGSQTSFRDVAVLQCEQIKSQGQALSSPPKRLGHVKRNPRKTVRSSVPCVIGGRTFHTRKECGSLSPATRKSAGVPHAVSARPHEGGGASGVMNPSLLDGGGALAPQGPAAIGAPAGALSAGNKGGGNAPPTVSQPPH